VTFIHGGSESIAPALGLGQIGGQQEQDDLVEAVPKPDSCSRASSRRDRDHMARMAGSDIRQRQRLTQQPCPPVID
jgi:hypothetical protein